MTISPGITAANIELTTGSYALIAPPAAGTSLGTNNNGTAVTADGTTKYIWLKLYEMNADETIDTPVDNKTPDVYKRQAWCRLSLPRRQRAF